MRGTRRRRTTRIKVVGPRHRHRSGRQVRCNQDRGRRYVEGPARRGNRSRPACHNANGSTIVMQSHNNGTAEGTGKTYMAFWYVPAVGRWVKSVEEFYDANGCAMRATRTNWCRSARRRGRRRTAGQPACAPSPVAAGHLAYRRPVTARAHLRIERRLRQPPVNANRPTSRSR